MPSKVIITVKEFMFSGINESYRDCLILAGRSFVCALFSVIHPDWLIGSDFRFQVGDNLRTDSHQNSWNPRVKTVVYA